MIDFVDFENLTENDKLKLIEKYIEEQKIQYSDTRPEGIMSNYADTSYKLLTQVEAIRNPQLLSSIESVVEYYKKRAESFEHMNCKTLKVVPSIDGNIATFEMHIELNPPEIPEIEAMRSKLHLEATMNYVVRLVEENGVKTVIAAFTPEKSAATE